MATKILKLRVEECTCERCGHVWLAQLVKNEKGRWAAVKPVACAKCKNPYWNRPRQET